MSSESLSQFLSAVSSEGALQQKLAAVTDSGHFVKMAQESGYNFTLEDLQAYIAQHNDGELSEDELEAVAGGQGLNIASLRNLETLSTYGNLASRCAPGGNGPVPIPGRGPGPGPVGHDI
jgi:predicted ribosomally synthesized peptide with nif11-like leader